MSNLYLDTVQIVGGVLTPFIIIAALAMLRAIHINWSERHRENIEKLKSQPPFDIELYEVPNKSMLGVRLIKDDEVIYDTGVDKP